LLPLPLHRALRHCYVLLALHLAHPRRARSALFEIEGQRQPEASHPHQQTDAQTMTMETTHEEEVQSPLEVHRQPQEGQRPDELRSEGQDGARPHQGPQTLRDLRVIPFTPKSREGGDAALLSTIDEVRTWITSSPESYDQIYICLWRKGDDPNNEGYPERHMAGFSSAREIVGFLQLHLSDLINDARPS
jgi:hypothetical protein